MILVSWLAFFISGYLFRMIITMPKMLEPRTKTVARIWGVYNDFIDKSGLKGTHEGVLLEDLTRDIYEDVWEHGKGGVSKED